MKIAIVKLSAMGDIIHAMVALQYIKKAYPSVQIDWIVEQSFTAVLEENPDIDHILSVNLKAVKKDKSKLFEQIRLVKAYTKNNYDLVIDAQGLIKSALVARLLGKNRAGFSKDSIREGIASYLYTQKVEIAYDANTIDRNARVLAEPLGIEITREMILGKEPFLFYTHTDMLDNYLETKKKNIVFVIGSTWKSRNYPKEKFAILAELLKQNVLISWGNQEEKERAEWIASHCKYATVLPKLDINALKMLIGKCDLLIGNDTGPTHMAWGMNRPSVTIFGPTPVSRVYQTPINKVVKSPSSVNPYKLDREDYSIEEVDPDQIADIAKGLLYD